ncbi:MAG: hypothetical protein V1916_02055 [Patescibacteria group bacterium]
MLTPNEWRPIDNHSTGYVGKHRNDKWRKRDEQYGAGNWRMAWLVDSELLEYLEACQLYEDAYFAYLQLRPNLLEILCREASDVYDDDPSNVVAGCDYRNRGAVRTHIQDTALRNCVRRLGRKFEGNILIQIRDRMGSHPLSLALSPGQVPFHQPALLSLPDNLAQIQADAWWLEGSVEDWYQRAKRLCVRTQ